jgi:branched-chain amino acid transport system substrate-binding protein
MAEGFVAAYTDEFDQAPDLFAAQGYTAMWMMAQALKEAGDTDPKAVAEALAELDSLDSVYGPITFEDGQARSDDPGTYLEWTAEGTLVELD